MRAKCEKSQYWHAPNLYKTMYMNFGVWEAVANFRWYTVHQTCTVIITGRETQVHMYMYTCGVRKHNRFQVPLECRTGGLKVHYWMNPLSFGTQTWQMYHQHTAAKGPNKHSQYSLYMDISFFFWFLKNNCKHKSMYM